MSLTNEVRSVVPRIRGAGRSDAASRKPRRQPAATPPQPVAPPEPEAPPGPGPGPALRGIRILLVEDVPQVVDRIREVLRAQEGLHLVAVVSDGRKVEAELAESRPDVVLVDVLLQGRLKGPQVIQRLRRARIPPPCVAITVADRSLTDAVRGDVDAVLTLPFGTFDLLRAIREAVTVGAARNPALTSRVVAVFSAKGGVGKTTLAYNLAVALGQTGLRTALLDGSLQYGDLRRLLRVSDEVPSICDLPTDALRSSDLAALMVRDPSGIDILFAPPRPEMVELLTTRDLDKILDMLRRTYAAVVVDTSSTLDETTLALLDAADVILHVATPESAALATAGAAMRTFATIGYPAAKLRFVVNRTESQGTLSVPELGRSYGSEPHHTVASDWSLVARSNAEGVPFVLADPDARVSRDLRAVAEGVRAVAGSPPEALSPKRAPRERARR